MRCGSSSKSLRARDRLVEAEGVDVRLPARVGGERRERSLRGGEVAHVRAREVAQRIESVAGGVSIARVESARV